MSLTYYILAAGVAAVITFCLALTILKLSHRFRLYPKIRDRDVHTRPTPRLGGVAMFLGVLAAFFVASQTRQFSLIFADSGRVVAILLAALARSSRPASWSGRACNSSPFRSGEWSSCPRSSGSPSPSSWSCSS
jgi:UDP-N-acetylmuramyl pentapeptide phosphotransferase/UDP-N-acetylglucosamine-1-phosphate transferase